ncbi:hypothetical protein [Nocardia wallacei]|uniref:hypothetical protein n=1 Tax=Nocardia wallacei TaxID=480035 RepID=UPI002458BAC7|nr:hypothetical protein [Nocardia wallacei]
MFPRLLPGKPMPHAGQEIPADAEAGYNRLTCEADASNETRIECAGDPRTNRNPFIGIDCIQGHIRNGLREQYPLLELWPRRSGTVDVLRATHNGRDAIWLTFDDLPRGQCMIYSTWSDHRMDELLAWWRSTPL